MDRGPRPNRGSGGPREGGGGTRRPSPLKIRPSLYQISDLESHCNLFQRKPRNSKLLLFHLEKILIIDPISRTLDFNNTWPRRFYVFLSIKIIIRFDLSTIRYLRDRTLITIVKKPAPMLVT